ncbi:MAG: hypothetical protein OHK0012_06650 [Synechococcales cyanobacterium]
MQGARGANVLHVFWAEWKRTGSLMGRYPLDTVAGILMTSLLLYGLLWSGGYLEDPTVGSPQRLDDLLLGYGVWTVVVFILNDIALGLHLEAQSGTLEHLFLSPYAGIPLLLVRSVVSLGWRLGITTAVWVGVIRWSGLSLVLPWTGIPPCGALLLSVYGLAFSLGSLALVVKRVQQVVALAQLGLLLLVVTPVETWTGWAGTIGTYLPMTAALTLLREVIVRGESLDWGRWLGAMGIGVAYASLGLGLFQLAINQAKRTGSLSMD